MIEIPETVEERMDEKFKNFKYCSDGPNEDSLLGEGRYGAVHKVQERLLMNFDQQSIQISHEIMSHSTLQRISVERFTR